VESLPLPQQQKQQQQLSSLARTDQRRAGVRSRLWSRVMVVDDGGAAAAASRAGSSGRMSRGARRESAACGRRKVPHAAIMNSNFSSAGGIGGGGGGRGSGGGGGGGGDRVRVPLERLKRAAVVGPNTLIVELEMEGLGGGDGGRWRPATLVVGPCDAARLGSLLVERVAMAEPRVALGRVIRKARELVDAPPPLPPRPSVKGIGGGGGGGGGAGTSVGEWWGVGGGGRWAGSWQSDPGRGDGPTGKGNNSKNTNTRFGSDGGAPISPRTDKTPSVSGNPFGSGGSTAVVRSPNKPPSPPPRALLAARTDSKGSFGSGGGGGRGGGGGGGRGGGGGGGGRGPPPSLPPRKGSSLVLSRESQPAPVSPRRRSESGALEGVLSEAVWLLDQAGRAVAALDDAYNAAYNAAAATDGWGGEGHEAAELGEAVLWALWSRLVRLHCYLRQLVSETPAQKLHLCVAVKRGDWKALAASVDAEATNQRSLVFQDMKAYDAGDGEEGPTQAGRGIVGSIKTVEGLCRALDKRVSK
ncbi:unnamed protein product, partial [Laminaria digitata]